MHSSSTSRYLAAFGLGYSLTTLKEKIICEVNTPNKRAILNNSVLQLKTFQDCHAILFGEPFVFPFEYTSDLHMEEFFFAVFETTEERISNSADKNLQIYFFAGGLIYLSDGTNVIFDEKKFKAIFYGILCELGSTISWNEMGVITSRLYCGEKLTQREAKKQILDFMFLTKETACENTPFYYPEKIYRSLIA